MNITDRLRRLTFRRTPSYQTIGESSQHHYKHQLTQQDLKDLPQFKLTWDSLFDITCPHSLRKHLINPLATLHLDSTDPQDHISHATSECHCVVCLEPYQVNDQVRVMPCGHVFHDKCICTWLLRPRPKYHECPICKTPCFPDEVLVKKRKEEKLRAKQKQSTSMTNLVSVF